MPRHVEVRRLPYTPSQVFDLVADVERYPAFVPWIQRLRTWNARTQPDGVRTLDAEAEVAFAFLRERFGTRIRLDPAAGVIDVTLLSGPFRRLENRWRFTAEGDATRVDFSIDYEFRAPFMDLILRANFDRAVARLIGCFEARAAALYA